LGNMIFVKNEGTAQVHEGTARVLEGTARRYQGDDYISTSGEALKRCSLR
ncbi:hypothetical protein Tco_1566939, partial [Tanacetum coccineum]